MVIEKVGRVKEHLQWRRADSTSSSDHNLQCQTGSLDLDFGFWICIVFQTGDKRLLLIIICNFNKLPWSKKEETNLIQPWAVVGLKVGIDILELSRDQPSGNICFLKE